MNPKLLLFLLMSCSHTWCEAQGRFPWVDQKSTPTYWQVVGYFHDGEMVHSKVGGYVQMGKSEFVVLDRSRKIAIVYKVANTRSSSGKAKFRLSGHPLIGGYLAMIVEGDTRKNEAVVFLIEGELPDASSHLSKLVHATMPSESVIGEVVQLRKIDTAPSLGDDWRFLNSRSSDAAVELALYGDLDEKSFDELFEPPG